MASPYPTNLMDLMWKYNIEYSAGASDERLAEIMRRIDAEQQRVQDRMAEIRALLEEGK